MNKDPSPSQPGLPENIKDPQIESEPGGAASLPSWLQSQLTREYSKIVNEPLPADLLDLVLKLEEVPGTPKLRSRGTSDE
jgi:hypothetical protein